MADGRIVATPELPEGVKRRALAALSLIAEHGDMTDIDLIERVARPASMSHWAVARTWATNA